jgi:hypothetical protein
VAAIEDVFVEVRKYLTTANLDDPSGIIFELDNRRPAGRPLSQNKTRELHCAIHTGASASTLAKKFGVSLTAIYKQKRKLGIK